MDINCIGYNDCVVFRLPQAVAAPQGWVVRETKSVLGGHYRIAEPPSNPRQLYRYWPWVPVRETREEAERDAYRWTGEGNYVYGAVVEFPLGGYVWYQTGLESRTKAEEMARRTMTEVRVALGLAD